MKITIENNKLTVTENQESSQYEIGSPKAFKILSNLWLRSGFDLKYVYQFTWMGRPIFQLPEDLIRIQEVIFSLKPDLILETGVAHGGSLVFYASLLKMMNHPGRVIGIDIEIRPHNRKAIEEHPLFEYITLIEGNSVNESVLRKVRSQVKEKEKVLVLLDSNHTKDHVLKELNSYSPMVSIGSYIVAMDGIMEQLSDSPLAGDDWKWNHPKAAVEEFLKIRKDFILEPPSPFFNEGKVTESVTYWPSAWLKRVS